MFVQAAGQGCAFITAILLARSIDISDYGHYIFGITVSTILAVISTMGAGGILARTWGRSDNTGFLRDKETFEAQNWYFRNGMLMVITIIALIFIMTYLNDSFNYIEFFALAFAIPFFMANILHVFFRCKKISCSSKLNPAWSKTNHAMLNICIYVPCI